ncbi:hypothetical protein [Vibrio sp. WXL210]|uniref:hypothetical protein n=1 Tax=Vibrio sp. WXL210 TaxID=3450709 RepID=UPI003EC8E62C
MTKRLCKLNRHAIVEQIGDIYQLVAEPKYVCRSCARSAADKVHLCKPVALPSRHCAAELLTSGDLPTTRLDSQVNTQSCSTDANKPDSAQDKKVIKAAKKALKKQRKSLKAMKKLLKKQRKLARKHQKLEHKLARAAITQTIQADAPSGALH